MQSFCWWCGKKLQLPFYTVVTDHLGHQQKIHKCCKADAEKEIRPATAQPKPDNGKMNRRNSPPDHCGIREIRTHKGAECPWLLRPC